MNGILSLGYVGICAADLADWPAYATGFLGMQLVDGARHGLAFRMDDRRQRFFVERPRGGTGPRQFFGWEVADAAALDRFAARLDRAEVRITRAAPGLAAQREVADLLCFDDPAGNRLELFHGARAADTPFRPGPVDLRLPHRTARHGPRRADGGAGG